MELKTKQESIIDTLGELWNGEFRMVSRTFKKALKKSRTTGQPTPANLEQVTVYKYLKVVLGGNYKAHVNAMRIDEGKTPDFTPQDTYCEAVSENGIIQKHKAREDYYVRVYPGLVSYHDETILVRYDKNGNKIDDATWRRLEAEYFPLKGSNTSQGLDKPLLVNNYKLENVLYLNKDNNEVVNELSKEIIDILEANRE
jgi:hypothetical protein